MSNAIRNRAPGNRVAMVQHQKNRIQCAVVSAQHQGVLAVKDEASTKRIITVTVSANALDFHPTKAVAQQVRTNKAAKVNWPEVAMQQHVDRLAASKAVPGNNVRCQCDDSTVKSAANRRHNKNHCLNIQSSRLTGTGKPTNSLELI